MDSNNRYRVWHSKKTGERDVLNRLLLSKEDGLKKSKERFEFIEEAQILIQAVAQETQEQLRFHIEDLVSKAMEAVFPDPYQFKVFFDMKNGKTEARLMFERNGSLISPLDASGGGAVDVASFALRVALWALGDSDNVIILDEPFRFLSRELQPKAGEMLKQLSVQLGLQFIMNTHNQDLQEIADRLFIVRNTNGIATVTVDES